MEAHDNFVSRPKELANKNTIFNPKELTHDEIISGLQNKDESVLGYVYSKHIQDLYRFGSQFTSDTEIVKDCIQDVFARLIKRNKPIKIKSSIKSYLFKSTYRSIIEKLQKSRKYQIIDDIPSTEGGFEMEISYESRMINDEGYRSKVQRVNQGLTKLSKKQKQAILLYYFDGMTQDEIADLMSLKDQNSVFKLIRRGLESIRQSIGLIILLFASNQSILAIEL